MGYAMLWTESLAATLLLVATALAWAAGSERRWWRILASGVAVLLPLTLAALITWMAWYVWEVLGIAHGWMGAVASWTALLLIGEATLVYFSQRPVGEPPARAARNWPRRKLALAASVALVLGLLTSWTMDTAARTQLASLRAEAGTLALAATPPRIAENENAAPLYHQAFEALLDSNALPPVWQGKSAQWFAGKAVELNCHDADLVAYLRRQAAGLELLRRAAARPSCAFERNYGHASMVLPEAARLRGGARDLSLEARCKAAKGDAAGALANVAAILRMARHTASEPVVIMVLVGASIESTGMQTLELILSKTTPTLNDLVAVRELATMSYRTAMQRALQMEEATGLSVFVATAEGTDFWSLSGFSRGNEVEQALAPFWRLFLLPDDLAGYRERMQYATQAMAQPPPQAVQTWKNLDETWRRDRGGFLTAALTANLLRLGETAPRADAYRRLTQLAVAVAEYRAREGKYPTQLDELVPSCLPFVPIDPYTGQPLKLVIREGGLVLYSVGPDLKDDGGTQADLTHHRPQVDITLRIGKDVQPPPPLMPPAY
ncbi:hypothetical protein AYO44_06820 [Planctomycetaceae bacterium SCGC AG-212-F19]|nr:hypothetical protein AYO44_06820 [Planctomycetaceae bacterium SCGC AG-212-F19]